jgi:hypothetical protein
LIEVDDPEAFARYRKGHAMNLPRRTFLHLAAGAVALPAVSRGASAQTYPARPITMIVPYPSQYVDSQGECWPALWGGRGI